VKLGLHTYSYHYAAGLWDYVPHENAPMTVDHYFRKAAELRLDGLYLCDARHLDSLEYGYISGLRERAAALGLYLELGTTGTNPDHMQNMVRAAHVLGSPLVRTVLDRPRPATEEAVADLLAACAAELRQVLPVCERYGVQLALENGPQITSRELLSLIEAVGSPLVRVCFDTANPLCVMEDPVSAATALAPLAITVHLKDYQLAARLDGFLLIGCPLGKGAVDLRGVLEILAAHAPNPNLNIETFLGKQVIPALADDYLVHFPAASARALGRTLRLVRDRGLPSAPPLPTERGASEAEVLAEEDDFVLASVHWALQALHRPSLPLPELP
jgi:sugar phosphate isomerase/epimerase